MESSPGSPGAGHSRGLKDPFCSRRSLNLQGAFLLLVFSTHSQSVGATRNRSITYFETIRPWDKALKTERHCRDFHSEDASTYFFYWPEDDPDAHFEYCCSFGEDSEKKLRNYTYGIFGPGLGLVEYYDLGLIDKCLPYWRCHNLFKKYFETTTSVTYCEMTDLGKLYKRRFMVGTVLQHGLLKSAIPFIISLEILVVLLVALYWCIWGRPVDGSKVMIKAASKAWFRHSRKTIFKDWTHLCLLAIVGNGLIEAVGRQNPYVSQSKSFYNYARLYVVLSILVWYSSVLLQVTYWIAEIDLKSKALAPAAAEQDVAGNCEAGAAHSEQDVRNTNSVEGRQNPVSSKPKPSAIPKPKDIFELNDDWKWQPIGAQTGILFCLWGFLTYSVNDATTGSVFGLIVSAACPWSGLYASKIIVRAFPWLLSRLYDQNLRQQSRTRNRRRWRSVLHLNRWTNSYHPAQAGLARQDDSGTLLELDRMNRAVNEP